MTELHSGTATPMVHRQPKPLAPTGSYTATYDAWNRLVDAANSDTVSEYAYDGAKRRIVQKTHTSGSLSETRHDYSTDLGTSPDSADAERQFVWNQRYIDGVILRDRDTDGNGSLNERLYASQDANWNVTALFDASGAVQERFNYAAYGQPEYLTPAFGARGSSSYDWEVLYCGYRYEAATGGVPCAAPELPDTAGMLGATGAGNISQDALLLCRALRSQHY